MSFLKSKIKVQGLIIKFFRLIFKKFLQKIFPDFQRFKVSDILLASIDGILKNLPYKYHPYLLYAYTINQIIAFLVLVFEYWFRYKTIK